MMLRLDNVPEKPRRYSSQVSGCFNKIEVGYVGIYARSEVTVVFLTNFVEFVDRREVGADRGLDSSG